jgi:hypothetical protein
VTGRTESDPAAEVLLANILTYVWACQPPPRRSVQYRGDAAGRKYLESAGVQLSEDGGRVAAFGLGQQEARMLSPGVSMEAREHIASHFEALGPGSPFTGISPADVHNRDPRDLPLVTGGAQLLGDGVLAASDDGRVVFSQIAPWQFDPSAGMNQKRTFRNVARMTARLLANLGAEMRTPLLGRFGTPAGEGESRWLNGLYLDIAEEWDDPYRFFRW